MPQAKRSERDSTDKSLQIPRRSSRIKKSPASIPPGPSKRHKSPFFWLPAEVRNMIYSYMVYYPKGLVRYEIHRRHSIPIQSWLVNRQIYLEFSALFYRVNTFRFHSGYVRTGDDPFGPRLDRVERCYLHLAKTRQSSNAFLKWFVDEFVAAVAPAGNLKYLIVRMADHQKDCVQPLELLSGIRFALIQVGQVHHFPQIVRFRGPSGALIYSSGPQKAGYEQRLERALMSDNGPEPGPLATFDSTYVSEPPLSTDLTGEALQEAQRGGGWADDYHLFRFLGIKLETGMTEELHYTNTPQRG
ncbi:MAG: hypothetical protein L6R36_008599 [Xanthoria steineri]|nr:MAG: hypothetical protein L6R36_008599 [Xanthoria steineri]